MGSIIALSASAGAHVAYAAAQVPYADVGAKGSITLCDKSGKPVRGGALRERPFAWTAVSSERAPAPYDGATRTATLFAFQPRKDVPPGDWSGSMLTASSKYTNTAHPMAQATNVDWSLADFLSVYPASWDGLVQLRVYLGAANQPILQQEYATADLRVTGDHWELVEGGDGLCNAGKAVSLETTLLPADFFAPDPSDPNAAPGTSGQGSSSSGQPGGPGGGNAPAAGSGGQGARAGAPGTGGPAGRQGGQGPAAAAGSSDRTSSSGASGNGSGPVLVVGAAGVVALAAGAALWTRSRRRRSTGPGSATGSLR